MAKGMFMTKLHNVMFQRQSSIQHCVTVVKENMCYVKLAKSRQSKVPKHFLPCNNVLQHPYPGRLALWSTCSL